jgi:hypothetical protein
MLSHSRRRILASWSFCVNNKGLIFITAVVGEFFRAEKENENNFVENFPLGIDGGEGKAEV